MERRYRAMIIGGVLLVLVGLVWVGQGTGFLRGTGLMVGDGRWAVVGLVLAAVGVGLAAVGFSRGRGTA